MNPILEKILIGAGIVFIALWICMAIAYVIFILSEKIKDRRLANFQNMLKRFQVIQRLEDISDVLNKSNLLKRLDYLEEQHHIMTNFEKRVYKIEKNYLSKGVIG